jgi:hypothetical protein
MNESGVALLIASVLALCGCGSTIRGYDAWPHQPYLADGSRAYGDATVRYYGWPNVGMTGSLTWRSSVNPELRVHAAAIERRCIQFLHHHGINCEPIDAEQRKAKRYDSEADIWNGLNYREAYALAASNPVSRGNELHEAAVVIVAIEPTVLVIAPGLVGAGQGVRLDKPPSDSKAPTEHAAIFVGLSGGLLYDDRIPKVDGLLWCSPDLGIAPRSIEIDASGVGTVPLPWGVLRLVPAGNIYAVLAAPD